MDRIQRKNFTFLILIAATVFILFAFPNAAASKNLAMVDVFSSDEAAPLPTVFRMIAPTGSLEQTAKNFIFYGYYPYGLLYFAYSAAVLYPVQWLGLLSNTTLVMLVLRQMVSVLPMLAALLLLVYMQDGFKTYRSYVLFIFLAAVTAVVQNNLWWHPDGMVTFFAVLTLFLLNRDRHRFGKNFYLAAMVCGLAVATKLIGVYFFLAVGLVLVLGLIQKKITWLQALKAAILYLLIMAATYLISSPFLLFHGARDQFIKSMQGQSAAIAKGYGIIYQKGLLASWPIVHQFYGELIFLLICLACLAWGIFRGSRRLMHGLMLAWLIPLSATVFYFSHFKFQYWLPAILPVISCVILLLPEKLHFTFKRSLIHWLGLAGLMVGVVQFGLFLKTAVNNYHSALTREQGAPEILFYDDVLSALAPVGDAYLYIYHDPNMYLPETSKWSAISSFDLLTYAYIEENNFDVLLLTRQRIRDYLNPNAEGIDAENFAASQNFYRDADTGGISGYVLIHENDYGKIFVRDEAYNTFFTRSR